MGNTMMYMCTQGVWCMYPNTQAGCAEGFVGGGQPGTIGPTGWEGCQPPIGPTGWEGCGAEGMGQTFVPCWPTAFGCDAGQVGGAQGDQGQVAAIDTFNNGPNCWPTIFGCHAGQAVGGALSAPPNCPTVQQCPPTWNCGGGGGGGDTAATVCTQYGCGWQGGGGGGGWDQPIGPTGWLGCTQPPACPPPLSAPPCPSVAPPCGGGPGPLSAPPCPTVQECGGGGGAQQVGGPGPLPTIACTIPCPSVFQPCITQQWWCKPSVIVRCPPRTILPPCPIRTVRPPCPIRTVACPIDFTIPQFEQFAQGGQVGGAEDIFPNTSWCGATQGPGCSWVTAFGCGGGGNEVGAGNVSAPPCPTVQVCAPTWNCGGGGGGGGVGGPFPTIVCTIPCPSNFAPCITQQWWCNKPSVIVRCPPRTILPPCPIRTVRPPCPIRTVACPIDFTIPQFEQFAQGGGGEQVGAAAIPSLPGCIPQRSVAQPCISVPGCLPPTRIVQQCFTRPPRCPFPTDPRICWTRLPHCPILLTRPPRCPFPTGPTQCCTFPLMNCL